MGRETSLNEWRDRLSKYYADTAIRRLYYKHNGSYKGLADLLMKKMKEYKMANIKNRAIKRHYDRDINIPIKLSRKEKAYKEEVEKKEGLIIFLFGNSAKFNKFFKNEVYKEFIDKGISEKDFIALESILRDYYFEYTKMKQLEELIKQDSIKKREKKIKKILELTNSLLNILDSDLYNKLPTEVKIKTISELNKTTEEKLKELNLVPTYSYSYLLQSIRKI